MIGCQPFLTEELPGFLTARAMRLIPGAPHAADFLRRACDGSNTAWGNAERLWHNNIPFYTQYYTLTFLKMVR